MAIFADLVISAVSAASALACLLILAAAIFVADLIDPAVGVGDTRDAAPGVHLTNRRLIGTVAVSLA